MRRKNFLSLILLILLFFNILAWTAVYQLNHSPFLEVNFFDIGQGDAIFIKTPQGHQILIDGGPTSLILEKLTREMPFWDRSIDLIILTHPEKDHIFGLLEVLKRYEVEFILWNGVVKNTFEWKEWKKLIDFQKEKGVKVIVARANQRIDVEGIGSCNLARFTPCIFVEIFYPWEDLSGQIIQDSNDTSIVVKLVFDQKSFLFTGDIYENVEEKLIENGADIDSDVLKVAHHGSKTSSSGKFIEKVSPEIAIIQVGKNNHYGLPYQGVLENLSKYGINILRTDQEGDIKIISDGKNLKIK